MTTNRPNAGSTEGTISAYGHGSGNTVAVRTATDILAVAGDYFGGEVERRPTSWPIRVGVIPGEADSYQSRTSVAQFEASAVHAQARTTILSGLGGTGKTQLAASLLRQALSSETAPELVVWSNAASRESIIASYTIAATAMGLDPSRLGDEFCVAQLLAWFETPKRRWFVVLDDLRDGSDLRGLWPSGRNGDVVVTTTIDHPTLHQQNRAVVIVPSFEEGQALTYLEKRVKETREEELRQLARRLGFLPLALAQATDYIMEQRIGVAEYRRRLDDQDSPLLELLPADSVAAGYGERPANGLIQANQTWSLSLAAAEQLEPRGLAHIVLEFISVLDGSGIPIEILLNPPARKLIAMSAGGFGVEWVTNTALPSPAKIRASVLNLARYSLIELQTTDLGELITVHPLVQRVVRDRLSDGDRLVLAASAAAAVASGWPAEFEVKQRELRALFRRNGHEVKSWAFDALFLQGLHPIVRKLGDSLVFDGLFSQAVLYWTEMVEQSSSLEMSPLAQAEMLSGLAFALFANSSPTPAGLAFEKSRALFRAAGSDTPEATVGTELVYAAYLTKFGKAAEAQAILEALLNDEDGTIASVGDSIASPNREAATVLLAEIARKQSRTLDSIEQYERLLSEIDTSDQESNYLRLALMNNLAAAYSDADRHLDATALLEDTVAISQRVNGVLHPLTLTAQNSLGNEYNRTSNLRRARSTLKGVVRDRTKVLGRSHPNTFASRMHLADTAYEERKFLQATVEYRAIYTEYRATFGSSLDPFLRSVVNNMGRAYQELGLMPMALSALHVVATPDSGRKISQTGAIARSGESGVPLEALDWSNLGLAYRDCCAFAEAIGALEKSLRILHELAAPNEAWIQRMKANVEDCWEKIGWTRPAVVVPWRLIEGSL